jgi:hypothetical protein
MTAETPNFGLLLAPILSQVDAVSRPRFLALLERTAADRYRKWATELPANASVLLECAAREDEIADRIESAFSIAVAKLDDLKALLPAARDIYYAAFEGMDVREQIRVQSDAELQGAHAWRSIAAGVTEAAVLAELARCSELEEMSSAAAKGFLES